MTRFNLICNGMMLFHETGDGHVEIVIPNLKGHLRRFCFTDPERGNLVCLPVGSYSFESTPAEGKLTKRVSPLSHLMVKKSKVDFHRDIAARVSAIVTVPMPGLVRLFRSAEPDHLVFPGGMEDITFGRPSIHHDIVVFSYVIGDPTKLAIRNRDGKPINGPLEGIVGPVNFELYSTEGKALPHECPYEESPDYQSLDSINELLTANGKATEFSLDKVGKKDKPYDSGIGVTEDHMRTIEELVPPVHSGEFGCTSVMLAAD